MPVVLNTPKITEYSPEGQLKFKAMGGKLVSDNCQLTIKVTFTNEHEMNCALRVRVDKKYQDYFKIEPNNKDTNEYEIYRYYGKVLSGKTDTFNFRFVSNKTLEDIKAFAIPIMVITVYDCDDPDLKQVETIIWDIA